MVKISFTNYLKLSIVSTINCRVNRSIGKSPRDVKNTDFFSILYNKAQTKFEKKKLKGGNRVRISKNDIPFRRVTKHNLQIKF